MKKKHKVFFTLNFIIFIILCVINYNFAINIFQILNMYLLNKYGGIVFNIEAGETFVALLQITIFLTIIQLFRIWLMYFYKFFHTGMYQHEINFFKQLTKAYFLGLIGIFISVYTSITLFLPYFFKYNNLIGIENYLSVKSLFYFLLCNAILFFLIFQIPLIVKGLINFNIIKKNKLKEYRKHFFIVSLIISSFLTPPDIITTSIATAVMFLLYNVSII